VAEIIVGRIQKASPYQTSVSGRRGARTITTTRDIVIPAGDSSPPDPANMNDPLASY